MIDLKKMHEKYEMTIGVECHVQLATKTKLFSGADNDARGAEPNTKVSPIDWALPGMLPVLNKKAVDLAIKAGLALKSQINLVSRFDRKHYFYPDLPKGYQTTQANQPIIGAGKVEVIDPATGELTAVRIEHAHLEEDAGKSTHYGDYSLIDLNRAGTPLIEIVSEPDIHSAAAAKAYVTELHRLMTYSGVSYGDLFNGNMRFDINISVALKGAKELGERTEIKNLNSFRSVERAADYEFQRQVELLEKGEKVLRETRGWNEAKQKTIGQRSKEQAKDYRLMPEPDVPPIVLTAEQVAEARAAMPLLPCDYRAKWAGLELGEAVVNALLDNQARAAKLAEVLAKTDTKLAKRVANWFVSVLGSEENAELDVAQIKNSALIELAEMAEGGELSSTAAKEVLVKLFESGEKTAREVAKQMNLLQVNDECELGRIVDEVLALPETARAVADVKNGEMKAIGFLVGQVMKRSGGKANPGAVNKVIQAKLQ